MTERDQILILEGVLEKIMENGLPAHLYEMADKALKKAAGMKHE